MRAGTDGYIVGVGNFDGSKCDDDDGDEGGGEDKAATLEDEAPDRGVGNVEACDERAGKDGGASRQESVLLNPPLVVPDNAKQGLYDRMIKLAEGLDPVGGGERIYYRPYYHIFTNFTLYSIVRGFPTSITELSECGVSDPIMKSYGSTILNNILQFIEEEKLQKYFPHIRSGSNEMGGRPEEECQSLFFQGKDAKVEGDSVSSPRSSLKSVVSVVEVLEARIFLRIVSKPELYSAERIT